MRIITYTDAILALRPEATFNIYNNDYSTLKWYDQVQNAPTEEEVSAKYLELQAIEDASMYKYQRQTDYPSIGDQLDMLWHAMDADVTKRIEPFYSSIKNIKDRYPKP